MLVQRWDKKNISLSTVSKALNTLAQDLIVERKDKIRLLQPDKLLEKLSVNYEPPKIKNRVRIRIVPPPDTINKLILRKSQEWSYRLSLQGHPLLHNLRLCRGAKCCPSTVLVWTPCWIGWMEINQTVSKCRSNRN